MPEAICQVLNCPSPGSQTWAVTGPEWNAELHVCANHLAELEAGEPHITSLEDGAIYMRSGLPPHGGEWHLYQPTHGNIATLKFTVQVDGREQDFEVFLTPQDQQILGQVLLGYENPTGI